jgi:hypothetical protein
MAEDLTNDALRQRLDRFFGQARRPLGSAARKQAVAQKPDGERFGRFITQLRDPLDRAGAAACANPWLIAGLGHDEVRVSFVLAALWDRNQYGNEGRAFLSRFLARAGGGFPGEAELAEGYKVQTEHCLNGAVADRVDITVETRSSITGIEVKIYAGEGENQLARYAAAIATRARLTRRGAHRVIFLSPYTPQGGADGIGVVTWRAVAETAAQANRSSHAGWLISQFGEYCRSLGS